MSRPVVESQSRPSKSGSKIGRDPGDNQSTGRVEDDDVALRTALGATQEVLKQFRVLPCAATVKVLDDRRSET